MAKRNALQAWAKVMPFVAVVWLIIIPTFGRGQQLPTISPLSDISIWENTTSNMQFLVTSPDIPLASLTIQVASTNESLIPSPTLLNRGTNFLVGLPDNTGDSHVSSVSLSLVPSIFQTGESDIIITLSAPAQGTNVVTARFHLTVALPPELRFTGFSTLEALPGDVLGPLDFQVFSTVPPSTLVVTGRSSNQTLVKDGNIIITQSAATNVLNGTLTIATEATAPPGANVTITLTAADNKANGTSISLNLHFLAPPRSWSNAAAIQIRDNSAATPYPSLINVDSLRGRVSKIAVTLNGFSHSFPQDVGVLLVAPSGKAVVLMNGAGGNTPVQSLNLSFTQGAQVVIPESGALTNGTYQPANFRPDLSSFAMPAPAGPYTNASFDVFKDDSPNGTWALYIQDFAPSDAGAISNGWSLTLSTEPVMSGLQDILGPVNTALSLSFTVGDDSLSLWYAFSGTSDNPLVVTNGGIVFTGSGTNWTVTVNPVPNAADSAKITITMVNSAGQTVTSTFKATFNPISIPPVIAPISDPQTIAAGTSGLVPLNYSNAGLPQSALSVTFTSSDTNLVPSSNMKLVGTNLLIAAAGVQTGSLLITVTVANPGNLTAVAKFNLNVVPNPTPVFADTGQIVINDNNPATPYPSTINVSGLAGNVVSVTATVVGLAHTFPSDVSMLLVGPAGQKVVLMSRAGGAASMTNTRLTFDDSASAVLPQNTFIADGFYKPTDYKTSDKFFSPAPIAPYSHAMSAFAGTNPNGAWQLWVQDDQAPDSGVITGGWILSFAPPHSTSKIAPQTTAENSPITVPFSVSAAGTSASNLIVTASHASDVPPGLVSNLTLGGFGGSRALTITPAPNLPSIATNVDGTSTITVSITDGTLTNSMSFLLTVRYVNQPPLIAGLSDQTTPVNVPLTVNFTVSDVDTPISNVIVSATVSDPLLGTVMVTGSVGHKTLTYIPTGAVGTNLVSVTAVDGATTITNVFAVALITGQLPPVLSISRASDVLKLTVSGGSPNAEWLLQSSSDFKSWADITNKLADATGAAWFNIQIGTSPNSQFYRVRGR